MNYEIPDIQAGFQKGRYTRDQIANIHWILEKAREFQKNLFLLYWVHQSLWLCEWSHSVVSDSLWSHGLQPTMLLHPWDFPVSSNGVGSISLSRGSSWPMDQTLISCILDRRFTIWATRKVLVDCVHYNKLWKILKEMGIPDHLTYLLRKLYAGQETTVRTGHGTIDWFQIGKGVCQGCILSPCLFNLYAEYVMWNVIWMKHTLESRLLGKYQ